MCRVSVLSLGAGLFAFWQLRQTHALFLDLHATRTIAVAHWATFYAAVLVFWMLPVQLGARVMLNAAKHRIPGNDTGWYRLLDAHLPWVLGLFCMVAVYIGQVGALELLPMEKDQANTKLTILAADQVEMLQRVTLAVGATWLLIWAVLNPLVFRLGQHLGWLDNRWIRFIAATYFAGGDGARADAAGPAAPSNLRAAWAAVGLLLLLPVSVWLIYVDPLEIYAALQRAPLLILALGNIVPILTICVYLGERWRLPIMTLFVLTLTFIANFLPNLHSVRQQSDASAPNTSPSKVSTAPVRIGARQVSIGEAILQWRDANCPPSQGAACTVRPIIVAAEGGASRAAFFTASVLAHLEDLSASESAGGATFSKQVFAISTVSGSSLGAAVFAAMREELGAGSALPKTAESANAALWFKTLLPLIGAPSTGGSDPVVATSRKDAVQMILTGDFLSPAAAGLGRDVWAPWLELFTHKDRGVYLEQAWERRFAWYFGRRGGDEVAARTGLGRPFSSLAPEEGKWRPLLLFNGTSVTRGRRIVTATLHPSTDRQLSQQRSDGFEPIFGDAYDTYDLICYAHSKSTANPCGCSVPGGPGLTARIERQRMSHCDIPLSAAVSNSTRFPVISPHGNIVGRDGGVVDRIVDGGYFDNSGLVTAQELAEELRAAEYNPFILFISNDPGFDPEICKRPADQMQVIRSEPKPPPPIEPRPFAMLQYPAFTAIVTRVARSVQSTTELRQRKKRIEIARATRAMRISPGPAPPPNADPGELPGADIISVGARCRGDKQLEPIPINWWLSAPVQEHLDAEICATRNRDTFATLLSHVAAGADGTPMGQHEAKRRVDAHCAGPAVMAPPKGRSAR
jgi:hypothetical protein